MFTADIIHTYCYFYICLTVLYLFSYFHRNFVTYLFIPLRAHLHKMLILHIYFYFHILRTSGCYINFVTATFMMLFVLLPHLNILILPCLSNYFHGCIITSKICLAIATFILIYFCGYGAIQVLRNAIFLGI